ncbi:MAG: DUF4233 domain-containing protein [Propioniciclava sp.]
MNRALVANLGFEAIVFGLAIPGMIVVDDATAGQAFAAGGGAIAVAVVAAARSRTVGGWYLGWVTQIVAVALGLLTPWMFGVGGLFAGLHLIIYVLGRRIDRARESRSGEKLA